MKTLPVTMVENISLSRAEISVRPARKAALADASALYRYSAETVRTEKRWEGLASGLMAVACGLALVLAFEIVALGVNMSTLVSAWLRTLVG